MCNLYVGLSIRGRRAISALCAHVPRQMHRRLANEIFHVSLVHGTRRRCASIDLRDTLRLVVYYCIPQWVDRPTWWALGDELGMDVAWTSHGCQLNITCQSHVCCIDITCQSHGHHMSAACDAWKTSPWLSHARGIFCQMDSVHHMNVLYDKHDMDFMWISHGHRMLVTWMSHGLVFWWTSHGYLHIIGILWL